ncbi:RagB/SusD family nutrient uptake outer membrane protein [Lacibacter luteus]|uniref:RagB/SusD family nutrient uptake outer membrane protein n=1 Tax=Lacibacter luteus TaxID=2508719 RepID=A0A4Q1CGW7_9BACT|nr:RagB/SusD family nutrient uptake outer membrane protein [Lacibacter luteus]RXK59197.1 RagB/SusD family nutrient uptake outer membrane protein [Lacibacter luteus]
MHKIKTYIIYTAWCILLTVFAGCKKYLEQKPVSGVDTPDTLPELQGLLDRYSRLNINDPGSDEISSDDYYLTTSDWQSQNEQHRRMYIWEKDNLFPIPSLEWSSAYSSLYYANTVLEAIDKIEPLPATKADWNNIKGQAYFLRARLFFRIANIWSLAYDKSTASSDLGIPLRLTTDFNAPSQRNSAQETHTLIIDDLKNALGLLDIVPKAVTRPSKPAAAGLLARVYLSMREYDSCYKYADIAITYKNTLLNYNNSPEIKPTASFPFQPFNAEVIFYSLVNTPSILLNARAKVDSNLYRSFDSNDLRKTLFFRSNNNGTYGFKGGYDGNIGLFTGICTDELYLMRAELHARAERLNEAAIDLNKLLVTRWKQGTYQPYFFNSKQDALNIILTERRKQLQMRCLRWLDIKRLNKEGYNISLRRIINAQEYVLDPNSLRFALPIPEDIIKMTGMPQNPR